VRPTAMPCAVLAALLLLAGCGRLAAPAAATPVQAVQAAGRPSPRADVAATVNGQPIAMATYQAQLQAAMAGFSEESGVDPNSPEGQAAFAGLQVQVLDWLIDQALVDQAAARQGIAVDDARVAAEVERIRNENKEGFAGWLEANGFTEETFRAQTRSDLLAAAMRDLVTRDVSGEEVPADTPQDLREEAFMRWLDAERAKAQIERFVGE